MDRSKVLYQMVPKIIGLLFIILFVYAATSKLLDFDQFKIQLGQSPIITSNAIWIAWYTPIMELIIALLFFFPRLIQIALYASLSIMTLFTTYIILILRFSEYIPCSCGGILETMSWWEHLIFNIIFMGLAILGILLTNNRNNNTK